VLGLSPSSDPNHPFLIDPLREDTA
jgi:hypothetical protein